MLVQRAHERVPAVKRHAGGNAEVGEAFATHAKGERIFERLKSGEEAVGLDHDSRARGRRAGLLEVADELIDIDGAAAVQSADTDIRVDHHDGLDVRGQALEQTPDRAGLASIDAIVEAAPARLAQPQNRVVRGAVADQPEAIPIGRKGLHELLDLILEVEYGGDDREG